MEELKLTLSSVFMVFSSIKLSDVLDICIITFLAYKLIKIVRETRAEQLVKGIALLAVAGLLAPQLNLKTVSFALKNVFQMGVVALIVLFQPELRRALEKIGRSKVTDLPVFSGDSIDKKQPIWSRAIVDIGESCEALSSTATGALIVIERKTRLGEQIATGIPINAQTSKELFGNIFFPNSPMHDGAVIMRDGRIVAAGCFLPKPQKEEDIGKHLGSRHRAAIGMSEVSDAIVIVVSEETGTISVALDGELTRGFDKKSLEEYLTDNLIGKQAAIKETTRVFRKGNSKSERED